MGRCKTLSAVYDTVRFMLIRLRYASTLSDATTPDDLVAIVAWSAEWNRAHAITGILAVDGRKVMQVLEGSAEAVDALFVQIARDPRHHGVIVLDRFEIPEVSFDDWGMVRRSMVAMLLTVEGW
ncbi:MAG: BLUF domain-containing protein [Sphingomonadales bacterium]|nr:MAG: BLUF domain-containing protein [Sphingomonadales bacterium]